MTTQEIFEFVATCEDLEFLSKLEDLAFKRREFVKSYNTTVDPIAFALGWMKEARGSNISLFKELRTRFGMSSTAAREAVGMARRMANAPG